MVNIKLNKLKINKSIERNNNNYINENSIKKAFLTDW